MVGKIEPSDINNALQLKKEGSPINADKWGNTEAKRRSKTLFLVPPPLCTILHKVREEEGTRLV